MSNICAVAIAILFILLGIGGMSIEAGDSIRYIATDANPPVTFFDNIAPDPYVGTLPDDAVLTVWVNDSGLGDSIPNAARYNVDGGPWLPMTPGPPAVNRSFTVVIDLHNWTLGFHTIVANGSDDGGVTYGPGFQYEYLTTDWTEPEVTFVAPTPADGATVAIGTQITVRIDAHDFVDIWTYGGGATLWWKNSTEAVYTKNILMAWDGWAQGSNHNYFIDDSSIVKNEYAQVTYYVVVWDGYGNTGVTPERHVQFGYPWVALDPGWNLISIWLIQENTTIEHVLSPISGKYDSVQYYDAFNSSDHWKTYSVFKPNQLNDLTDINHTIGFWINAIEITALSFDGEIPLSTNITLKAGWNLVGYPRWGITGVDDVFASLPELERIECFDPAAPYRIREMESFECLSFDHGYWFKVSADCVWTVNWW